MGKKIRLTESQLKRIVARSVSSILMEGTLEGTDKQNAFLRKLMGPRYKDEYDRLSVRDSSAMIDAELARQKGGQGQQNVRMATQNQIGFLMNNRYHKLPWVSKIADRLTFSDASELCDAVSAYKGRVNAGGWSIRTTKDVWIPSCAEKTSGIARKYGLEDDAKAEEAWASDFAASEQRKKDRAAAKQAKADMASAEIVFVSTHDDKRRAMFGDMGKGPGSKLYNIYMHGDVEDAFGWDIPTVVKGYEGALNRYVDMLFDSRRSGRPVRVNVRVEGYDKPCWMVLWFGRSKVKPNGCVGGLVVDKSDTDSVAYAEECARKGDCDI